MILITRQLPTDSLQICKNFAWVALFSFKIVINIWPVGHTPKEYLNLKQTKA